MNWAWTRRRRQGYRITGRSSLRPPGSFWRRQRRYRGLRRSTGLCVLDCGCCRCRNRSRRRTAGAGSTLLSRLTSPFATRLLTKRWDAHQKETKKHQDCSGNTFALTHIRISFSETRHETRSNPQVMHCRIIHTLSQDKTYGIVIPRSSSGSAAPFTVGLCTLSPY